ncbi:hypothetical protein AcV5_008361 [Taiwanofungus camphoratus]|nr:hypothetical protein AcV5_008361 [Antrodia cinnamomea]KAI0955784.1 hypothetical protein AcV7_006359 [Antrodia cinnamomea]
MAAQHPAFQNLQKASVPSSTAASTCSSGPVNGTPAPIKVPSAPATNGTNVIPSASPPKANTSNLCEGCHVRPKYFDGTKTHPYCGKSCAAVAKSHAHAGSGSTCTFCHSRPKYFDGTTLHPYCSKTCAQQAKANGTRQNPINANGSGMCQVPDCNKPAYKPPNGTGKYCGLAHKRLAENACLLCRKAIRRGDRHFCGSACADEAQKKAVILLEIPEDHVTFRDVATQFKTSWRHAGSRCPAVRHIYKIVGHQVSLDKYEAYKNAVESRGQFLASGRSAGNENRRWHGTRRECSIGDKGHTQFCSSSTCSLCCIIKTSFDIGACGKNTGWGRFGVGVYTSSTSSKSNDYSHNTDGNAPLKAILLNKVVVGKGCKITKDDTTLTAPPAGYDSVLAEKGDSLNHDELVVYSNDAIRPSYLVMYDAR